MNDPLKNRIQLQIRIDFKAFPTEGWRKWLFDPHYNLILPNKPHRERQKPLGHGPTYYDFYDEGEKISRYLWLSFSLQILGLDIGGGIFWRKKYDSTTESNTT